jgi:hypothetical protein
MDQGAWNDMDVMSIERYFVTEVQQSFQTRRKEKKHERNITTATGTDPAYRAVF